MSALILTSDVTFSAPLPDTPYLPDIVSGLYWKVRASDLTGVADGLATGTVVTSTGSAPLRDRTWDENGTTGTGWTTPIYHATGGPGNGPWLAYNGTNASLKNFDTYATPIMAGPKSFYFVFSNTYWPASGAPYLFSMMPDSGALGVWLTQSGSVPAVYVVASKGLAIPVATAVSTGSYGILIMSCDGGTQAAGGQISCRVTGSAIQRVNATTPGYRGMLVGRNWTNRTTGTPNLNGGVVEWGMYTRALSDNDINSLYASLSTTYGIV